MKTRGLILIVLAVVLVCLQQVEAKKYEPTWESLRRCKEIPEWLRNGKFGIYTHWGPYAVHAYGENTTWYSHALYNEPDIGTLVMLNETKRANGKITEKGAECLS